MRNFTFPFLYLLIFVVPVVDADGDVERALEQILRGEIAVTNSSFSKGSMKENRNTDPSKYTVKAGDTLDRVIYHTFRGSKIRKSVIRDAYVKANPSAFRRGNPNWLYAGSELDRPEKSDFLNVFFKGSPGLTRKTARKENWVTFP